MLPKAVAQFMAVTLQTDNQESCSLVAVNKPAVSSLS